MIEVAGSLWSVAPHERLDVALRLRDAGLRRVHWDMTDGRFAAAGGFRAPDAAVLARRTGLSAEAHIMAVRSLGEVDEWTDFCDLVIVHFESEDWAPAVDRIQRRGATPGIAVSPHTPVADVPHDIAVLCMSVVPGQAGSAFDERTPARVAALRDASPGRRIGVDGGVRHDRLEELTRAGADWVVVGTDLAFDRRSAWEDTLRGV